MVFRDWDKIEQTAVASAVVSFCCCVVILCESPFDPTAARV